MRRAEPSAIAVADLLMRGVEKIDASCLRCGENWQAPISILPPATTLAKIAELMVCPACGGREVDIAPAWMGEVPKTN
jgi:Zn finger protein HypA/HybF involved in hydrogenase expression